MRKYISNSFNLLYTPYYNYHLSESTSLLSGLGPRVA